MWKKSTGESADMQNRLDHLVDELDHLDESFANHTYEDTSDESDMSWLDADDHGMQQGRDMPHADYSTDMFEGETQGRRPFKFLFGLFAVSTSLMLALLWFFWPNTTDINSSVSQSVAQHDVKATPDTPAALDAADESTAVAQLSPDPVEGKPAAAQDNPVPANAADVPEVASKKVEVTKNVAPLPAGIVKSQQHASAANQQPAVQAAANTAVEKDMQRQLLTVDVHLGLIRDAPGSQGKVVARLKRGTVVLSLFRQGDWYRIRFPDSREAWGNKAIFAVAKGEPAEQSTGQVSGSDTAVPVTASQPDTAADQAGANPSETTASSTDTASATASSEVKRVEQRQVLTVSVHLGIIRDAPGKHGKVVARLKQGTPVITLSRQGEWYRVLLAGREAWAHQSIF
ncbi:SH3 domain-containing protein [Mariprofundus ferrooxydans]|uniref:SH3 domain-containing protein n=1 Tax=Mariprofundus ferrooxydans TaxID=314344 RepID=UPI000367114A|nr:SH3 domain-containing protein [Mariprofundus ferrooxydans]